MDLPLPLMSGVLAKPLKEGINMTMKYSNAKCIKAEGNSPFVAGNDYRIFHSSEEDRAEIGQSISYGLTAQLEHISANCHLVFTIQ
ncbi:hypothetical protein AAEY46_004419 [Yersinia enterocolitica]|nr:hypothetical protein [Yersinia enterocolitica]HDL6901596.1 hypothetical protein [Yersinia enterocolitica]HDL7195553.1 hypothetical protein [Yersinia enterocolitica]